MIEAKILTCTDVGFAKEKVLARIHSKLIKLYDCEEFLVEDSKKVLKEAYIAEEQKKYLIITANSYRVEAQNSLLKLLEEPPRNIVFILIAKSKTALLPTIRSRMQIENIPFAKEKFVLELNVAKMELVDIFNFLKKQKFSAKEDLKEIIQALLVSSLVDAKMQLQERELALFDKSLQLATLNSKAQNILATLLLTLYHARGRKRS